MPFLSLPTELLYEVADGLQPNDIFSLTCTCRLLYDRLIHCLYRIASRHKLNNPKSLTCGLRDVSFWHDKEGNGSILEWSAIHRRQNTFERLLEEPDVDVIQMDSYGVTLFHRLAAQGMVDLMAPLMTKLIKSKQDPFKVDLSSLTPLHFAAGCGRTEAVKFLIEHGANVDVRDHHRNTPLHLAAVAGAYAIFSILVKAGADVNSKTRLDWTAIDIASITHHADAVNELIRLGSQVPTWMSKRHALNEYVRLSPCPKEYYFPNLEDIFGEQSC